MIQASAHPFEPSDLAPPNSRRGRFGGHSRPVVVLGVTLALSLPVYAQTASAPNWTYAWGVNGVGQLGRGMTSSWENLPATVPAVSGVVGQRIVALSVGADHVLAVRRDGSVWGWGGNGAGQLGNGTTSATATPAQVMQSSTTPLTNVRAVAAGWQFSLALKNDGTVWAWGRNANGELGDDTRTDRGFAAPVMEDTGAALGDVRAIAAGWGYGVAAKNDKTVWEWGRPLWRQVGAASSADRLLATTHPRIVIINLDGGNDDSSPPFDLCAVSAGKWHAVGMDCGGMVVTWGLDDFGQLGQNTGWSCPGAVASPCREGAGPAFLTGIVAVAAGDDYSLALDSSGTVFAWGANWYGMLGDGTTTQRTAPAPVTDSTGAALTGITAIAAGEFHALAHRSNGSVLAWGLAAHGRLGTSSGLQICPTNSQPCAMVGVVADVPAGLDVLDAIAAGGGSSAVAGGSLVTVLPGSKSLHFPFQPTLVESAKQTVSIFNRDGAPLAISAVTSWNPRFLQTHTCATPVPPDSSCDVDVSFKPIAAGPHSGIMDVDHPATGTGKTAISLTGSALGPSAGYQPSSLAFGDTGISKRRVLSVQLVNGGLGGLSVGAMSTGHPDFDVAATTCGSVLPGGSACTIDVAYQPWSLGAISAKLSVMTLTSNVDLPLSGRGVMPSAALSVGSLNFGNTNVGAQVSNPVTLTNTGTVGLGIASVTIIGSQQFHTTGCPASIPAGGACTVWVTYAPTLTGPAHATLRFDDDAGPHDVLLDGVGMPVGVPSVVPNVLSFLLQPIRTKSQLMSVWLRNTGGAPFTVSDTGIRQPHLRDFWIVADTCTGQTIHSSTTCSVSVVFTPLATGARTADLCIGTTAGPVVVDLRGSGDPGNVASTVWPQFGFRPVHGAFSAEETGIGTGNVANLALTWQERAQGPIGSSPAVADDFVFWGSDDGSVYAYSLAQRGLAWTFLTGGGVRSSPAVADGRVFVGSDDGFVYALEAATGQVAWQLDTNAPVVSSPTVADGVVYIGSVSGLLYAIKADSGNILWHKVLPAPMETSPAVANGVVYTTDFNRVRAIDARTGVVLWTAFTGGVIRSSPAASGSRVFVGADDGNLYAFDATTGATAWTFTTGGPVSASPAVADGFVYVGSDDGSVYALEASSGAPLWTKPLGRPVHSSPAIANGVLYVGADDRRVHALEAWTGDELWSEMTQGLVRSSPAVAGGVVFIGSDDGWMYAFRP